MIKLRKLMCLLIILAMLLMPLTAMATSAAFTDIQPTDWHYNAVEYAVTNGLFNGTSDTTFSPDAPMTRAMFVTVLGRYSGVDAGSFQTTSFIDVSAGEYYVPYVAWASSNKIVSGTGDGKFSPNDAITREQLAAMLYNYVGYIGRDTAISDHMKFYAFTDNYDTSFYAFDAMRWCVSEDVINGYDSKLIPQGTATRAQVATIFMNADGILRTGSNPEFTPSVPPVQTDKPEVMPTMPPVQPETPEIAPPVIVTDEIDKRPTGKSEIDQYGGYYDYDLASYIFDAVNDIRVENGLKKTAYSLKVGEWADIRSRELWQINYTDNQWGSGHVRPDGSSFATVGKNLIAENGAINPDFYEDVYINEDGEYVVDNIYSVKNDDGTASSVLETITLESFLEKWGKSVASGWYHSEGHRMNQLSHDAKTSAVSVYIIDGYVYFIHLFNAATVHIINLSS